MLKCDINANCSLRFPIFRIIYSKKLITVVVVRFVIKRSACLPNEWILSDQIPNEIEVKSSSSL